MKQLILTTMFVALYSLVSFSQIPRTLSYQGVLTDSAGTPRPDGSYMFTFSLYNAVSGGTRLWSEAKPLNLKRGLFSTTLGDVTPFPDSLKFDRQYWLNVSVAGIGELSPRTPLTSVGYSMNALRADTAKVAIAGGAWTKADSNIYFLNGNVGIGTTVPQAKLHINKSDGGHFGFNQLRLENSGATGDVWDFAINSNGNDPYLGIATRGTNRLSILSGGNIGIGTNVPQAKLHINNSGSFGLSQLRLENSNATGTIFDFAIDRNEVGYEYLGIGNYVTNWLSIEGTGRIGIGINRPLAQLHVKSLGIGPLPALEVDQSSNDAYAASFLNNGGNGPGLEIRAGTTSSSSPQLWVGDWSGATPSLRVMANGHTITPVLEITGSDFAEPFEMSETDTLPLGSLVVIDPEHPGKLKQATEPYDKRVAGVISGAGGIYPGIMVSKVGKARNTQYVAMSGKVYALATASNGAIEPGDLLTTSNMPGHAMKATDKEKLTATVIGKAMTSLQNGNGLVLVLVNLQ